MGCFAVTSLVAMLIWSPYYFSLQSQGGYEPIAANHARYVVGLTGWPDSAARQISNHVSIESVLTVLAIGMAVVLPGFLSQESAWKRMGRFAWGVVLASVAFACSGFLTLALAAVWGIAQTCRALFRSHATSLESQRRRIGLVLVSVWWLALLVTTPLYTPYLRLTLPWFLASLIAASLNLDDDLGAWKSVLNASRRWQTAAAGLALSAGLFVAFYLSPRPRALLMPDRRGVQRIAQQLRTSEHGQPRRAMYVHGEPAMFFQLCAAGEELVAPVAQLPTAAVQVDGQTVPTFLIVGPHSTRDARFRDQLNATSSWHLVEQFAYQPSWLVWLDLHDPRSESHASAEDDVFELYLFEP
jgi:hypothetical protein